MQFQSIGSIWIAISGMVFASGGFNSTLPTSSGQEPDPTRIFPRCPRPGFPRYSGNIAFRRKKADCRAIPTSPFSLPLLSVLLASAR
jgi:hypothetical protein